MKKTKKSKDETALNKAIESATTVPVVGNVHPETGNIKSDMRTQKEIDISNWLFECGKDLTLKQCNYIASSLFYESIPHVNLK